MEFITKSRQQVKHSRKSDIASIPEIAAAKLWNSINGAATKLDDRPTKENE